MLLRAAGGSPVLAASRPAYLLTCLLTNVLTCVLTYVRGSLDPGRENQKVVVKGLATLMHQVHTAAPSDVISAPSHRSGRRRPPGARGQGSGEPPPMEAWQPQLASSQPPPAYPTAAFASPYTQPSPHTPPPNSKYELPPQGAVRSSQSKLILPHGIPLWRHELAGAARPGARKAKGTPRSASAAARLR